MTVLRQRLSFAVGLWIGRSRCSSFHIFQDFKGFFLQPHQLICGCGWRGWSELNTKLKWLHLTRVKKWPRYSKIHLCLKTNYCFGLLSGHIRVDGTFLITLIQTHTLHSIKYVVQLYSESMDCSVPQLSTHLNIIMHIFLCDFTQLLHLNVWTYHLSVRHFSYCLNIVIKLNFSATNPTALLCRIFLA